MGEAAIGACKDLVRVYFREMNRDWTERRGCLELTVADGWAAHQGLLDAHEEWIASPKEFSFLRRHEAVRDMAAVVAPLRLARRKMRLLTNELTAWTRNLEKLPEGTLAAIKGGMAVLNGHNRHCAQAGSLDRALYAVSMRTQDPHRLVPDTEDPQQTWDYLDVVVAALPAVCEWLGREPQALREQCLAIPDPWHGDAAAQVARYWADYLQALEGVLGKYQRLARNVMGWSRDVTGLEECVVCTRKAFQTVYEDFRAERLTV